MEGIFLKHNFAYYIRMNNICSIVLALEAIMYCIYYYVLKYF